MKKVITYFKQLGLFLLGWLGMVLGSLIMPILTLVFKYKIEE